MHKFYCKHCDTTRYPEIPDTGDYLVECPRCEYKHYRHMHNGLAVHCDIDKREFDPIIINKKR